MGVSLEIQVDPREAQRRLPAWAITGGTGKYKEAGGELKVVDVSETEAQLTFKIID